MSPKIIIFAIMFVLIIIATIFIVLFMTGKLSKPNNRKYDTVADDLKKKRYDTEEYKGDINTKSLTELLGGDDWKDIKGGNEDLKTGIVSEELITEGNKRLEKALLKSEALNREKKAEPEEVLGKGIFSEEERTGLLEDIIEKKSAVENDYKTSILIPDDEMVEEDSAADIREADLDEGIREIEAIEETEIQKPKKDVGKTKKKKAEKKEPEESEPAKAQEEDIKPADTAEDNPASESKKEEDAPRAFTGKELSATYAGLRFDGETFKEPFIVDSRITSSAFLDVKFDGPIFSRVLFKGVSFKYAEFKKAYLIGCTFSDCDFSKADFQDAVIDGVKFINCTFDAKTDISKVAVKSAKFVFGNTKEDADGKEKFSEIVEKIIKEAE